MPNNDVITQDELNTYLKELPHWRELPGAIATVYQTRTAAEAIELFSDIAGAAEMDNHHPDVDWRYNLIFVTTSSHDVGGQITTRDIALASKISERAEALGAKPRIDLIGTVEIGIDTGNPEAIASQWAAGLGYKFLTDGSLADPNRRRPAIWFQETRTPNDNRLHLDVWLPDSESQPVLAELEASGVGADAESAPAFTVITDSQGNRFCICTEAGRWPDAG
ncbi:4a-hydroxytetrahydrobiopterin dehydratase [Glutamicibacter sp.]|uniref:4a-hydroxytetrahydrobiopterin dehydratase n=1 Tax=Glutamicibacter sp. TaxID=1931995 RepID=UPI0028BF3A22|nr:4a-hydroxytetrahydrobiopterin dehydratase [Glutamicibacter sp.]